MKVVLDTNVLLVSISPKSSFYWIFKGFVDEEFTLCVTTDILMEYEEILSRHLGSELATTVLQIIETATNTDFITRYYQWNLIKSDPDDNKFVDCAVTANARFIVTHDKHFEILKSVDFPKVEIISAASFKTALEKERK